MGPQSFKDTCEKCYGTAWRDASQDRVFPAPLSSVRGVKDWQQADFIYAAPDMHNMTRYLNNVFL